MQESLPLEPDDVVFTSELHVTLPALHAGCTTVIPTHRLRGAALAGGLERCGATVAFSVPYELEEVIEWATESGGQLPGRLRLLLLGSAPAYRSFLLKLRAAVQPTTEVWSVYAMTEMLPVTRVSMHEKLETPGDGDLVGAPFQGVQVRTAADGEQWYRT
jgi:acyl-CoA synthetase (AMP-forming)/AMP-acid ligase II